MSTPTGDGDHAAGRRPENLDQHRRGTDAANQQVGDDTPRLLRREKTNRPADLRDEQRNQRGDQDRDSMDRVSVLNREENAHGGVKVGSAFFGWLTATGTAVLLTALLAATGTAIGVSGSGSLDQALDAAQAGAQGSAGQDAQTIGIVGAIGVLVVLLVAYFCGGYVAGRMARFNGIRQGVAVWVWALVIAAVAAVAAVVAVVAAVAGNRVDVLGQLNSFPRIPVHAGSLTTGSITALVAAVVVALLGAVLGGLAGMRFHRRVDRAGLGR